MRSTFMLVPALLAATLAMAGCSSVAPPRLTVGTASLERSEAGGVLQIQVKAENPNKEPIPLREFHYTVEVDGAKVFKGVRSAESTLRRFGERTVTLPVAIVALPADRAVSNFRIFGELTYREPGALAETLLDVELIEPSVGFSGQGSIQDATPTTPPQSPQE
jgi:hypothetical protein